MSIFNRLLDKEDNQELPGETEAPEKSNDFFFCLNMKKYFDIEEEEIQERLVSAIRLTPPFRNVVKGKPDLYGPFWMASTLVVIIIASSSLIDFFSDSKKDYNFDRIPVACILIYGICFGCPYIIALMAKFFGSTVSVVELICIYGYSLTVFLPITAVLFIDSSLVQIILLALGYCWSSVFLIRGILSLDRKMGDREKMAMGAFIMGMQLLLVLMYKLYFFNLI